jgi:signal transduction histidine kinase
VKRWLSNRIRQTTLWLMLGAGVPAAFSGAAGPAAGGPETVLTSAAQVRALSPEQAAQKIPVQLHGVVLADPAGGNSLVMQDATEAVYLTGPAGVVSKFHQGDLIAVTGVTDPGGFAPVVNLRACQKTGTGPLPRPVPVTFGDLLRKQYDAQFIELSGIVRSCDPSPNTNDLRSRMEIITSGGERLSVRLHERLPRNDLVDAEVRLQGICYSRYNANRQFLSPVLDVPPGTAVTVEKPAPADPWNTERIAVADLLKFAPQRDYGHRVRVRGVVTYCHLDSPDGSLWLRDGDRGLQVQSDQSATLQPGTAVEVLGFPARGDYSPVIEDALFRINGSSEIPRPALVTNLTEAVNQDANLIQIQATLNSKRPVQDGWALTLNWLGNIVEARIKMPAGSRPPAAWTPNSVVRVSGICSVTPVSGNVALSGIWEPAGFSLQLRSPADLSIVVPSPWWTHDRIMVLLGWFAGVSVLLTVGVTLAARRRLREQNTRRAMAEAEFAAILSERNRLAREIHDTLAQGLTATSVQLRLARKDATHNPEQLAGRLNTAQTLVRESLEEARKSIWNMRSQVLETGDLVTALEGILKQLTKDTGTETRFEVAGHVRRLAPAIENNVLRTGQEAITNAAKHAGARLLVVRLNFAEKNFTLTVSDNGCGFTPANPPQTTSGSFGLVGMRERAELMHGQLVIQSAPGEGTSITLRVPLTGDGDEKQLNNP